MRTSRLLRVALASTAAALLGACADSPLAPSTAPSAPSFARAASGGSTGTLLACPASVGDSATAVIDHKGGVVRVAGSELRVGPGAVGRPTAFTMVVPASPVMEVEIRADGASHYEFRHRVQIAIDYSRCADSALPGEPLSAWFIDSSTRKHLSTMRGTDDRDARVLTFYTDHLSGYAAAY